MRVFCRVKPAVDEDDDEETVISYPQAIYEDNKVKHHTLELFNPKHGQNNLYNFDHVFLPDST